MNSLTAQDILDILPHRYPFLMIDRVLDYSASQLTAIKNFTINEPYVQGHFPGNHIMPGVMMIECMAQASAILATKYCETEMPMDQMLKYMSKGTGILFSGADQVRFKHVIVPGDQLQVHTRMTRQARNLFEFDATVTVQGIIAAEAKLKAVFGAS